MLMFASHNTGKIREVKSIFTDVPIITPADLGRYEEIPETGESLEENAFLKADYFYRQYKTSVFADDTGLIVPVLNGAPGIYSARFAGPTAGYDDNNRLLLEKMAGIPDRYAYFISVICYIDKHGGRHFFTGKLEGEIAEERRGIAGFGYDPLFYIPCYHRTLAELGPDVKNKISHRYKALQAFYKYLKENEYGNTDY